MPCQPRDRETVCPPAATHAFARLPTPVATAWETEVERGIADQEPPASASTDAILPEVRPPVTLGQRLGDYALIGIAATAAVSLFALVLTQAHRALEIELAGAIAFAVLALAGGHLLLVAR
ncbi:MAG: hypothetical protein MUF60_00840, partial [Vicinamibacterales bacterium]|nr:hypothetical protein [Vicinamibacterales bacterium]